MFKSTGLSFQDAPCLGRHGMLGCENRSIQRSRHSMESWDRRGNYKWSHFHGANVSGYSSPIDGLGKVQTGDPSWLVHSRKNTRPGSDWAARFNAKHRFRAWGWGYRKTHGWLQTVLSSDYQAGCVDYRAGMSRCGRQQLPTVPTLLDQSQMMTLGY